jgi:hypothetical protein
MSFKSIGDLAISVLAKLEIEATEEGCANEAHSLRPATGKSGDQLSSREGTAKPVAYARKAPGGGSRNENGKGTASEPAAKLTLIVVKEPTRQLPRVLPVSKRMKVARPTGVAPRHAAFIRLVTVNGHLIQPSWKAS